MAGPSGHDHHRHHPRQSISSCMELETRVGEHCGPPGPTPLRSGFGLHRLRGWRVSLGFLCHTERSVSSRRPHGTNKPRKSLIDRKGMSKREKDAAQCRYEKRERKRVGKAHMNGARSNTELEMNRLTYHPPLHLQSYYS